MAERGVRMGLTKGLPRVVDTLPGGKSLINAMDFVVNWGRANSLWPLTFGTACCAIEMMATSMSRYDIARFGSEVFRASPRQADLIIVAGTVVEKMAEILKTLYEQIPGPKYVMAMGSCAISGGPFYYDSYTIVKGVDRIIPVDVYIPGCPPRPEALLKGLLTLQGIIKKESMRNPWKPKAVNRSPIVNLHAETAAAWQKKEALKDEAMAEKRKKFKEENPDYRPYKHKRKEQETFADFAPAPARQIGLPNEEIIKLILEKYPEIKLHEFDEVDLGKIRQLGPGYIIDFAVAKEQYVSFIHFLKNHPVLKMDYLLEVTAIDWQSSFDVVAHLLSTENGHKIFLRCAVDKKNTQADPVGQGGGLRKELPSIPSISHIYPAADWHEREVCDLFGINFEGHPDLRRLVLPDGIDGYPLRKDFHDPDRVIKRPY